MYENLIAAFVQTIHNCSNLFTAFLRVRVTQLEGCQGVLHQE